MQYNKNLTERRKNMAQNQYRIVAYVNNVKTEVIISANSTYDAKALFMAQYAGAKVTIWNVTGPLR